MGIVLGISSGCSSKTYPADKLKNSLLEICKKEYDIDNVDVQVIGKTIGVYLPLKKLFATDLKEAAVTGKVRNLETLFEPSPEALEKVEDVLFSISRVLLSTDKPIEFYVLEATDVEKTGMQLVLTGFVDDIKRVRFWDISRNEYRKRVVHDLRLNRSVIWHRPVRSFFEDLGKMNASKIQKKYFGPTLTEEAIQNLFFNVLPKKDQPDQKSDWEVLDLRSIPIQKNQILTYAKVRSELVRKNTGLEELQYLLLLSLNEEEAKIVRIIPFQYRDEEGKIQKIPFPKELQIEKNLDEWEKEFPLEEIRLGPFLANQLNRRMQGIISTDERIQNTFRDAKLNFDYLDHPNSHFEMSIEATLRDFDNYSRESVVFHEDMLYLLNMASREFVDLVRSYQFGEFDYLSLNVAREPMKWILGRDDLELFRRKKVDLQGVLTLPKI